MGGYTRRHRIAFDRSLLLPLRDVEGAQRMRQDVRDSKVCFALVGDNLRAASTEGARR